MAEPEVVDPSTFYQFPEIDPSDLPFIDHHLFPDGDLRLPDGLTSDLDFDDISLDFSIDDLILPSDDLSSPDPNSIEGDASVISSNSNPTSPESGGSSAASGVGVPNEDVKLEEESRKDWGGLKRKKDKEEGTFNPNPNSSPSTNPNPNSSSNPRNVRLRQSEEVSSHSTSTFSAGSEDDKRKARLMRNRESAQLSRQRKKHYVEELEDKVRSLNSTLAELNGKMSFIMAENATLRQQLNGNGKGGNGSIPSAAVYPPPPPPSLHFPWFPYSGYPLRPNGHVPLVPIPKLKPQQPAAAPKVKKSESRKSENRTKKVASVSLLGLFFIMLVFGGTVFRLGGSRDMERYRVFSVTDRGNGLNKTEGNLNRITGKRCSNGLAGSEPKNNSSESLPALLYVPRNGKHVEINGNLIIHSVLASERTMAQEKVKDQAKRSSGKEGTDLAIPGSVASALAVLKSGRDTEVRKRTRPFRNADEYHRRLAADSNVELGETFKSDGYLQQWFREGLAGPILSSGTCTEVFQFEVSPSSANPNGIIPANKVVNATANKVVNATADKLPSASAYLGMAKNRRILYPPAIPLIGATINDSQHFEKPSEGASGLHHNGTVPSMIVSILADPREAGDGDGDGMIAPKSLSRIFVVVLIDSVKYVTYSCVLPLKGHAPHLVK